MNLSQQRLFHLSDVPIRLSPQVGNLLAAKLADSRKIQDFLVVKGKIIQNLGQKRICHKFMDIIGTVEETLYEISLLHLLIQYGIGRIREPQAVFLCIEIDGEIVTASADLMITFSALPVFIQPVPPGNNTLPIRDRAGC